MFTDPRQLVKRARDFDSQWQNVKGEFEREFPG
jgi:hypothetical protein